MGLDAFVRCNCLEEGKMKPGPIPLEDLYVDEEGYLWSHKLENMSKKYDRRQFEARYGALESAFFEWSETCCEHEDGEYCSEWVSNIGGCAQFRSLVEECGGEAKYPLLSNLLPKANEGFHPVEKAQATLKELDEFLEDIYQMSCWMLCDVETGTKIWTSTKSGSFIWMYGTTRVGMNGGKVFFAGADGSYVETSHFKQIPYGDKQDNDQPMKIICLDCSAEAEVHTSIGPNNTLPAEREFHVVPAESPFLHEGKYYTAERIRNLLTASIETGNPIRWC